MLPERRVNLNRLLNPDEGQRIQRRKSMNAGIALRVSALEREVAANKVAIEELRSMVEQLKAT